MLFAVSLPERAVAASALPFVLPVEGAVIRRFEAPRSDWGPGHRGIDISALPGTNVRAAGTGVVVFAGRVAGVDAVTIDHGDGLSTTYSSLDEILVGAGARVAEGAWIGRVGTAHAGGAAGLHFGVKLNGVYADPDLYLGAVDVSRAIHLVPTVYVPPAVMGDAFLDAFDHRGSRVTRCTPVADPMSERPPPPNDNVAVAVAGLGSRTRGGLSAVMYEDGPEPLGYADVYRFSYRGHEGGDLHEPYQPRDTWQDIRSSARSLGALLADVGRRHPGRSVDLIAHSQGGIVARTYLTRTASSYDPDQPRVEHLVTLSSPHTGAPLAGVPSSLEGSTLTGRWVNDLAARWARSGGPVPDPDARSLEQIAPGSDLLDEMAAEDVLFGTRVLAVGIVNDGVVPADRALVPGEVGRIVGPRGMNGHEAVVSSPETRAIVHAWLRDADPPCPGAWEGFGRTYGRFISGLEANLPWLYGRAEDAVGGRLWRVGGKIGRAVLRRG